MRNILTVFRPIISSKFILLLTTLFCCSLPAFSESADDSLFRNGAIQRIADSYLSPLPNVPEFKTDFAEINKTAKTGDIIIENNLAFPQYYAIFGTLMPDLRYVHAQMVISGEDLQRELQRIEMISGRSTLLKTMHVKARRIKSPNGEKMVNVWEPYPSVNRSRLYCVGPEFVREVGGSYVVAMDLEECVKFPSNRVVSKALKLLRPSGITDAKRRLIATYLAYHVFMATTYDARFTMNEKEAGIIRDEAGKISFDFRVKPAPQYCTEIIHRALRFAGLPGAVLIKPLQKLDLQTRPKQRNDWWRIPANHGGSLVVAEGFLPTSIILYENTEPYSPAKAREQAQLARPIHHEWQRTMETIRARLGLR